MSTQLPDPMLELAARADAGQKLAMASISMLRVLYAHFNLPFDLKLAAAEFLNADAVDNLDPQTFQIEKRSREIVAGILTTMQAEFDKANWRG